MKHRFSSLLRALILPALCLCLPATSFADSYEGEFKIGNALYYIIGPAPGEVEYVTNYDENLTELNIPETVTYEGVTYTVTSIGQNILLFSGEVTTKVTIPSTVKKIRRYAFDAARVLTELTIPSSVEEIEGSILCGAYHSSIKKLIIEQNSSKPICAEAETFISNNLEEVYLGRNLVYYHNQDIFTFPVADNRKPMFSPKLKKLTIGPYANRISFKDTFLVKESSSTYGNTTEQVYPFGEQPLLEELIFAYGSPKNCFTGDFKNWGVQNITINQCYVYAKNLDGGTVSPSPFSELSNLKK